MNRGEALGFDRIRQDDELLDRLGRREQPAGEDALADLLQSWANDIDDDAANGAFDSLFGARSADPAANDVVSDGGVVSALPPVRTVQVRASRAAAVVGAAALVMSGSGVAAAVSGQNVPIVSHLVSAARPAFVPGPDPTADVQSQAWAETVDSMVKEKLRQGDYAGANELLAVIPPAVAADPDVAAKMAALRDSVAQAQARAALPSTPSSTSSSSTTPSSSRTAGPVSPASVPSLPSKASSTTGAPQPSSITTSTPRQSPSSAQSTTSKSPTTPRTTTAPTPSGSGSGSGSGQRSGGTRPSTGTEKPTSTSTSAPGTGTPSGGTRSSSPSTTRSSSHEEPETGTATPDETGTSTPDERGTSTGGSAERADSAGSSDGDRTEHSEGRSDPVPSDPTDVADAAGD